MRLIGCVATSFKPLSTGLRKPYTTTSIKFLCNYGVSIQAPKSGRQTEVAFVPQKLAHRLGEYIRGRGVEQKEKIFRISYPAARIVVKKAGELVGISLRPHDLRRHAATYASRSGTPIEIVRKVILRHANLATTQRYLGKVTDFEAIRWIESLHG